MIKFKACPKCRGDVHFQSDHFGAFWQCFQCSLSRDVASARASHKLRAEMRTLAGRILSLARG